VTGTAIKLERTSSKHLRDGSRSNQEVRRGLASRESTRPF
jgi:hypothetical protein